MKFEDFNLSSRLLTAIKKDGITEPTQIQKLSIPHILNGRDIFGESATGSGKTLAFGSGIVESVLPNKGIQALVLAPTRELAEQVKNSLVKLSVKNRLRIIAVYGGVSISPQITGLRKAEVVVATPGRLLDHISRGTVNLSRVNLLVLDEADRMLDMGFIEDVEKIMSRCPKKRQTLFFSATLPPQIRQLAKRHLNNPVVVSAKNLVDPAKLKQVYYNIRRNLKMALLIHLLHHEKAELVMVFCNTRRNTDFVVKNLKANSVKAVAIHGGFSQNKRANTLTLFNDERVRVLVCTDVAARGLHIENISHIYNYELPKDSKDYIHRIGRTARAGEEGKVINLLSDTDFDAFTRILNDYSSMKVEEMKTPFLKKVFIKDNKRSFGRRQAGGSRRRSNFQSRGPPRRNRR